MSLHFDGHVEQRLASHGIAGQGVRSEQAPDDRRRTAPQTARQWDVHVQEQLQPRRFVACLGKHGAGGLEHQIVGVSRQIDSVGQHGAPTRLPRHNQREGIVDLQRQSEDVESAAKIGRRSRNADAHLSWRGMPHHVSSIG